MSVCFLFRSKMAAWQPYLFIFIYAHIRAIVANIWKTVQDRPIVTINHEQEVRYELSFGTLPFDLE